MSAPQFTPGPWEAADDGTIYATFPVEVSHPECCGAFLPNGECCGYAVQGCHQELVQEPVGQASGANARLIAATPDYHTACGGALHPGEADTCGPLAWLRSAIDTLKEDAVRVAAEGDDQDAYWTMVNECEELHRGLTAALAKARGGATAHVTRLTAEPIPTGIWYSRANGSFYRDDGQPASCLNVISSTNYEWHGKWGHRCAEFPQKPRFAMTERELLLGLAKARGEQA